MIDANLRVVYISKFAKPGGHWNDPKHWNECIPEFLEVCCYVLSFDFFVCKF